MAKKFVFGVLVVIVFAVLGCGSVLSEKEFVIKISGTDGLKFNGSYMITMPNGKSTQKSVDGTVPTEYKVKGMMASVAFQKQSEIGTLKVEIISGEKVVAESDTTAAYGMVTVATPVQ